ncbi:MAG: peptidylprolyl isomerase [Melioribacteraceae bacterium]|nr:peptidylprolyl isomerase [Melioribacteraceae bacterium]MCF8355318.1 peptidylprolyl isomerase [Melioribacteraceae bacterium]MCF8395703.1 peptidylprolyl isomerase [Melioribacteraceae bacterium]MCF8420396.1 peptidylprolyl isomerase [Melioribacteraceae bacterium]
MKKIFVLVFFIIGINVIAQNVLDRVVAVINNETILKSELDFRVNYLAARSNLDPNDNDLQVKVLNQMIEEKLLYVQAELDSIQVPDERVDAQLDQQMNYFISQYGSREKVEQIYGMSIERIKREFRDDVRKEMMAQTVQQQKFGMIDVTRNEVHDFFEEFQDSLGLIPEKVELQHIFVNPKGGDKAKAAAKEKAKMILDSLKKGGDFAELAKQYSDDPGSASQGGDLGFVKRGVFFPEFEAAAFSLEPGQISGIVESPVGYHIIELLERRGESIHTRHVLIKVKGDDDSDLRTIEFLTDIRDSILSGEKNFEYYANEYSDDKETANYGGTLGTFEMSQLDKNLLTIVEKLKPGEISFPKRLNIDRDIYGYHIVKLVNRVPEHQASLEQDFEDIKRLAEFRKKQKLYEKWISKLKDDIYWEIKI